MENETTQNRLNLTGKNFRNADLQGADLQGADLRSADLKGAALRDADLRSADLQGADLRDADLQGADLKGADLRDADLRGADLQGADLRNAYLQGADLRSADLRSADLKGAGLKGATGVDPLVAARLSICPEGDLVVWKSARTADKERALVKLLIPADAERSNATGRKCRASRAVVLEIVGAEVAFSRHDARFVYRVGETVEPYNPFDPDRWNECTSGIHFFLTREEAEAY